MTSPRRIVYKSYAGFTVKGDKSWAASSVKKEKHLDKATWLTAAIEVGATFGTVQSYDGAGMSAGIEHKIAVLPKTMEQGSLWELLSKIEDALEPNFTMPWVKLFAEFERNNWYLDVRGILRNKHTGQPITGQEIREEFTPFNGNVPASGPAYEKALKWIKLFSDAFSDPVTFQIQIRQAKLGLLNLHKNIESQIYKKYSNIVDASVASLGTNISPELDLAMCIYHSYSVNAPTKARQTLELVFNKNLSEKSFCYELVKALGTNSYGNWKARYTRTWTAAKNSKLFDEKLFEPTGIAPSSF